MSKPKPRHIPLEVKAQLVRKWNQREPMEQHEIAMVFGKSRGWVSLIERRALEKIRAAMEARI